MGLTQKLGTIPLAILTDASNNVGIGAAPSGSYKLEVTGTAKVSSTLLVSGVSTLTGNVFLSNGSGNAVATLGGSPTANDGASLSLIPSNSAINWAIRVNWNLAGALEFCPSTAGGGSTFSSTPSFYLSSTGLATFSSFGSHSFSSAGTGYNKLTIRNTTAGASNGSQLSIGTNADPDQFYVQSFATTFTTSGMNVAGGAVVNGEGPGGLNLAATQSSIGFYTNGSGSGNLRMNISSGGNIGMNRVGNTSSLLSLRGINQNSSTYCILVDNAITDLFQVRNDGLIFFGTAASAPYNYNVTFSPRTAGLGAGGDFGYITSTRESKGNIKTIKNIDFINQLNPVSFNYRKKNENKTEFIDELYEDVYYGFIADEVEALDKNLVFYDDVEGGGKKLSGVHYNSMIAILTKAVQELSKQNEELSNRLIKLENK